MSSLEGNGGQLGSNITSENHFLFCYKGTTTTTSSGVFSGDHPFDYPIPLLLFQIITIFTTAHLTHALLKHIGIPQVISHLIAGIILGPSFLCHNNAFAQLLFPVRSWVYLDIISLLSFMLFIFIIGVKTDLSVIRTSAFKGFAISECSAVFPFILSVIISLGVTKDESQKVMYIFLQASARWAVTSNSVLTCLLNEFNLLTSKLGRLALSASLISDMQHLILTMLVYSVVFGRNAGSSSVAISSFCTFVAFSSVIIFLIRPIVISMVRRTPKEGTMDEGMFLTIVLIAIGCGLIGEVLGHNAMLGPLLLGLVLPSGPPLGTTLMDRLERFVVGLFLPIYLLTAGLRTNLFELNAGPDWAAMTALIMTSIVVKFGAVVVVCVAYCKMLLRDAAIIGLMMNCRGIVEVNIINTWFDNNMIEKHLYTVNIIFIVVGGGLSASLLKLMYDPSSHFTNQRHHRLCRTIVNTDPTAELRIMACVHHPENVPSLLSILQSTIPTSTCSPPLCIYLLHLIPLFGHATATLAPYKKRRCQPSALRSPLLAPSFTTYASTASDSIVNAFHSLEEDGLESLTVIPFVGRAPYVSMHDDICTLAYEKCVVLILLPFHKYISNGIEHTSANIKAMNINVLNYACCSVAILVDRCESGDDNDCRVGVVFLGGADDREALAYGSRMANNPTVKLTAVIRVSGSLKGSRLNKEEKMDEKAIEGYKAIVDGTRVVYREEVVVDGVGTMEVLKRVCKESTLMIVGRREGVESPATAGLEEWSEYKELGVLGDIMATGDFASKVSTLVVQQQVRGGDKMEDVHNIDPEIEGRVVDLNEGEEGCIDFDHLDEELHNEGEEEEDLIKL